MKKIISLLSGLLLFVSLATATFAIGSTAGGSSGGIGSEAGAGWFLDGTIIRPFSDVTSICDIGDPCPQTFLDALTVIGTTTLGTVMGGDINMANFRILNIGNAGTDFDSAGGLALAGDLQVNGADLWSTAATFNLLNGTTTTINVGGAATTISLGNGFLTLGSSTQLMTVNGTSTITSDLNVNGGDFLSTATTFNLLNTTVTTLNLGAAATSITMGGFTMGSSTQLYTLNGTTTVTSDLNVNGGDLLTSAATFNLLNATATTINFGGAATTLAIGLATPAANTTINSNLVVTGTSTLNGIVLIGDNGDTVTINSSDWDISATGDITGVGAITSDGIITTSDDLWINGGDLKTTATTFNLVNGTTTTLNIGGAATSLNLGAATGTTTVANVLDPTKNVRFSTGTAVTAAQYEVGRDADGTNQLHFNVPTGATFEFSVNDAVEMTLSASAVNFQNNSITTTGGGSLTGTWSDLGTVTTVDINGGTIDGVTIGGAVAGAVTGTAITGTSFVIGANTLTTTEWAFLDGQDQSVFTTSNPTFGNLTITSFAANWTNAGRTVADLGIVTTVDVNGGTLAGVTVDGDLTWSSAQTGLTLTTPTLGTSVVLDQTTADYTLTWADPAAARAISIPDPLGTDVFVFRDMTQTLLNKTLTSPTIGTSPTAAGATWTDLGIVTTADINGGTIDGTTIGSSTAAAGTFTTVTSDGILVASGGAFGLSVVKVAKAKYDFAVDGGAATTITPATNATIPDNAIIVYSLMNSTTAISATGAVNYSFGVSAGGSTTTLKGSTGKASFGSDVLVVGDRSQSSPAKMTAAGSITITIDNTGTSAGVIEIIVWYIEANA